jgi:hypothetical protein
MRMHIACNLFAAVTAATAAAGQPHQPLRHIAERHLYSAIRMTLSFSVVVQCPPSIVDALTWNIQLLLLLQHPHVPIHIACNA